MLFLPYRLHCKAAFPQPNQFNASIPLPATNSIGFGFHPCNKWTLALDVNLVELDVLQNLGV